MLRGRRRDLAKVMVFVSLAVVSVVLTIGEVGIVSLSYATRVGVHSLLAFWVSIPAAVIVLALQHRYSLSRMFFGTAFLFAMLVQIGRALPILFQTGQGTVQITRIDLVSTLIEFAVIGLMFVLYFVFQNSEEKEFSPANRWGSAVLIISCPVAVYSVLYYFLLPSLASEMVTNLGFVAVLVALFAFVLVPILAIRKSKQDIPCNLGYITSGSILMILSAALVLTSVVENSGIWIYAENLRIASFLLFGFSLAVPFLKNAGFPRMTRYAIVLVLALSTYLPLLATTIIETLDVTLQFQNPFAFGIINIGACCLAAMMAVLLYAYSRIRPSGIQLPLILLFTVWAAVFLTSVLPVVLPIYGLYSEQLSSYISGSMITLVLLRYFEKRSWAAPPEKTIPSGQRILIFILIIHASIGIGEVLNLLVLQELGSLQWNAIGNSLLLTSTLVVMFGFAYVVFLLAQRGHGTLSFESYVVALLSLWIVPVTLKSFSPQWTAGWWLSENLLFIGMLLGPLVLGFLYMRAMREADRSYDRARLFADLLMHDITNYNQVTLTTLELLESGQMEPQMTKRLVADAKRAVSMAETLVENVRLLSSAEGVTADSLEKADLVSMTVRAMDSAARSEEEAVRSMNFRATEDSAPVPSNSFLLGALVNLIYAALEVSSADDEVVLNLKHSSSLGQAWFELEILVLKPSTDSEGSQPSDLEVLPGEARLNLRFQVVEMVAGQLGGFATMRKEGDSGSKTRVCLTLSLPAWEE